MTSEAWAGIATPIVVGIVGFWLRRVLANQDRSRDLQTAKLDRQTELIEQVKKEVSSTKEDVAIVKTRTEYHQEEISRFRNMIDRWNPGPPRG